MIEIHFSNEHPTATVLSEPFIAAVEYILKDKNITRGEISLAVVDDKKIHELNLAYLDHDYPTDVLSFALEEGDNFLEGEVIVSYDTAKQKGVEYAWPPEQELLLYVIHGTLHLVGYDDKEENARLEMRQKETEVLRRLGAI
ncbi:MAG: rRNA maturation RNase YbeY [Pirellulaceae bacterium]|nr:rRNA maturation RNase YbeY [Pirellulaceae bacterium]